MEHRRIARRAAWRVATVGLALHAAGCADATTATDAATTTTDAATSTTDAATAIDAATTTTDAATATDATEDVDVAPIDNTSPHASFTAVWTPGGDGRTFTVDASESDDPDDPPGTLRFRWDWESTGAWTPYTSNPTAVHTFLAAGSYAISLQVIDIEGDVGEAMRIVKVLDPQPNNTAPVAAFDVTPDSGAAATVFEVDASASSDAEDATAALKVRWDWESTGSWTAFTTDKTASHAFDTVGAHVITVEVMDSGGLTTTATHSVTTSGGDGPTLDQQQLLYNGGTSARTLPGYTIWQSFTAGLSGTLVQIDMGFFNDMSGYAQLDVLAGDGTSGQVLATQRVPITGSTQTPVSWNAWTVSVPVQAGQLYTFEITPEAATLPDPYGVAIGAGDPYPRGVMGIQDPSGSYRTDFDVVFRTYVSPAP